MKLSLHALLADLATFMAYEGYKIPLRIRFSRIGSSLIRQVGEDMRHGDLRSNAFSLDLSPRVASMPMQNKESYLQNIHLLWMIWECIHLSTA